MREVVLGLALGSNANRTQTEYAHVHEPNRTEPNRTEPNRTEPSRAEPSRAEHEFVKAELPNPELEAYSIAGYV
ncbi:MAG: hypothetical protein NTW52_17585 [Planctomycetota bacterium]|nr:hypothetical protein [Planctomycetota bacterium]